MPAPAGNGTISFTGFAGHGSVAVWLIARPADVPNAAAQAWMNVRLRIGIDVSWVTVSERLGLARRIDLVFSLRPPHLIRALGRRRNSSPEVNHDSGLR